MGVIELIWLAKLGNKPQVYKDVVLEMLGAQFANKSIEIVLYWIATVSGIAMIAILMIIAKTKGWYSEREIEWKESQVAISSMLAFVVGTYILWGGINANVILLLITACISCHLSKTNTIDILCFQITILYAVIGLYRLFVWMGGATSFNSTLAGILAFGICNFILLTKNNCIIKFQLAFQLFVPFSLLIFLVDRYKKDDSITVIKPEKSVYYLIVLLIVIALVSALLKIKTCWNMGVFSESISIFTTITIMAVNRFSGSGFIMTTDTHHPAENTIAYNEIINLGRKVFTEYDPVSGLYSFVQGLFLDVFGDGKYTGYHISNNVYYLVIVIISVIAIRFHLKPHLTMLLCSFILITDYCRVALFLPFVLLLSSKRLVELPVYWMIMWVLFGWAYGLYYPAYGVAVIASFIPVGIYQIARLKESFIKARKGERISYILLGSTVFVIVFMSLPLLIGTAKHVLDMSDGMLYVDGVTIFGQSLPGNFMGYLNTNDWLYTIRLMIGYVTRFSGPPVVLWIAALGMCSVYKKKHESLKDLFPLDIDSLIMSASFIFPLVCLYFSLYRMGPGTLFNRAVYIIVFSLLIFVVLLYEYGKNNLNKYILVLMAFFLCALSNQSGLGSIEGACFSMYTVPEDYVYYSGDNEKAPNLGAGFIQQDLLAQIEAEAERFSKLDRNKNYFMMYSNNTVPDHGMGFDAILNIRGTAMLESLVVRGYSISRDTAEKLVESNAIVGNVISPADHYYLYKWLMTGGKYIWNNNDQLFYPAENMSLEAISSANSKAIMKMQAVDVGKYAASLGNSIGTLENVLYENERSYNESLTEDELRVDFKGELSGEELDYLYVSGNVGEDYTAKIFGDNHTAKNVIEDRLMKHAYNSGLRCVIEWMDDAGGVHTMSSVAENGKLLIPIGAGTGWLCNDHKYVKIWFEKDGNRVSFPDEYQIRLFRVRDMSLPAGN